MAGGFANFAPVWYYTRLCHFHGHATLINLANKGKEDHGKM
jgi:hypothetical protein